MPKSCHLLVLLSVLFAAPGLGKAPQDRITLVEESRFPALPLSRVWNSDIMVHPTGEFEIDSKSLTPPAKAALYSQWPMAIGYAMKLVTLPAEGGKRELGFISSLPWAEDPLKSSLLMSGGKFWKPELMPSLPPLEGVVLIDFFSINSSEAVEPMIYAAKNLKTLVLPFAGAPSIDWEKVSPSLERLYLFNVSFTLAELEALRKLPNLKSLYLHKCRLSQKASLEYLNHGYKTQMQTQTPTYPVWNPALTELSTLGCDRFFEVWLSSYSHPQVREVIVSGYAGLFPPTAHWGTVFPKLHTVHCVNSPDPQVGGWPKKEREQHLLKNLRLYVLPRVPPNATCEFIVYTQDF